MTTNSFSGHSTCDSHEVHCQFSPGLHCEQRHDTSTQTRAPPTPSLSLCDVVTQRTAL